MQCTPALQLVTPHPIQMLSATMYIIAEETTWKLHAMNVLEKPASGVSLVVGRFVPKPRRH